jgi:hypothetical protein
VPEIPRPGKSAAPLIAKTMIRNVYRQTDDQNWMGYRQELKASSIKTTGMVSQWGLEHGCQSATRVVSSDTGREIHCSSRQKLRLVACSAETLVNIGAARPLSPGRPCT